MAFGLFMPIDRWLQLLAAVAIATVLVPLAYSRLPRTWAVIASVAVFGMVAAVGNGLRPPAMWLTAVQGPGTAAGSYFVVGASSSFLMTLRCADDLFVVLNTDEVPSGELEYSAPSDAPTVVEVFNGATWAPGFPRSC